MTGQIIKAEAERMPERFKEELKNEFGKFHCILFNYGKTKTVKQFIYRATENINHTKN